MVNNQNTERCQAWNEKRGDEWALPAVRNQIRNGSTTRSGQEHAL